MTEQPQIQTPLSRPPKQVISRPPSEGLNYKDIVSILRQHIWLVIILTITGLIIGGVSWFLCKRYIPKYTSAALIEVLSPMEKDPLTIGQYTIDKENRLIFRASLASLITQPGMLNRLLDEREKVKQTKWFKKLGGGPGRTGESIRKGVKDLKKHLSASAERDSDFIRVSMTSADANESALIVNEMTEFFVKSRESTEKNNAKEQRLLLDSQVNSVDSDITLYARQLNDIRQKSALSDLDERSYQDVFTLRLTDLEIQHNNLLLDISNTQAEIKTLERQATGNIEDTTNRTIETDNVIVLLNQQSALLESELASSLTRFGPDHIVVRQAKERLAEINNRKQARSAEIGEIIRQSNLINGQDTLGILTSRLNQLQQDMKNAEEQKRTLDMMKAQYAEIVTKRDEAQTRLAELRASREKYSIIENSPDIPKVRIASPATAPMAVSFPRWQIFFLGGTFLGLMLGVALAFAIEMLNELVRTPRDVARFLKIPQLGIIPDADEDAQLDDIEPTLALIKSPYSVVAEAYRNLRSNTRLLLSPNAKSILVTSPSAGDGKTSVAVNLAASLAAQGSKILLIDANFWKPRLKALFPQAASQRSAAKKLNEAMEAEGQNGHIELGLSTVLAGLCGYHEVIRPSGFANCDIVDSGELAPNPAELLGSPQMAMFVRHQSEKYDYVIIDGPPALLVGDVKQLAKIVDGTILVFNAAGTKRGAAQRIISDLQQVNASILGCCLFGVRYMKGGYFREQIRAYQEYQKAQLAKSAAS